MPAIHRLKRALCGERRASPLVICALIWVALVYYAEWVRPRAQINQCSWGEQDTSTRVLLVADPQLIDENTYPGRPKPLLRASQTIVDRYLAKNWRLLHSELDPDVIVFLGDLFDGGREWPDDVWLAEFDRWNQIFPKANGRRTLMNLPGNHDIGYGDSIVPHALARWKVYFGEPNQVIEAGGHNIVTLDTISLENTNDPFIYLPPEEFLFNLTETINFKLPRILLSHVPLYRPKGTNCGRFRESENDLPWVKGYQYVTQAGPKLTDEILQAVHPAAVFSGDDHDACHVVHKFGESYTADEFTVKSMSMAMGVAEPGVQLLTLDPNYGHRTSICLLSRPMEPFIIYGVAVALSLVVLGFRHWPRLSSQYLPVEEKKELKRPPPVSLSVRHAAYEVGVLAFAWLVGQWVIGRWAYGPMPPPLQ